MLYSNITNCKAQNAIDVVANSADFKMISTNVNTIKSATKLVYIQQTMDITCRDSTFDNNTADYVLDATTNGVDDMYNCDMSNNKLIEFSLVSMLLSGRDSYIKL